MMAPFGSTENAEADVEMACGDVSVAGVARLRGIRTARPKSGDSGYPSNHDSGDARGPAASRRSERGAAFEYRHEQGQDDAQHEDCHHQQHHRFQQPNEQIEPAEGHFFQRVGDIRQHGIERIALFADADHLHHRGREVSGRAERGGQALTAADVFAGVDGIAPATDCRLPSR